MLTLYSWNLQSDIWEPSGAIVKKEIYSDNAREKLSERLHSDVLLHHTEFRLSLLGTVC